MPARDLRIADHPATLSMEKHNGKRGERSMDGALRFRGSDSREDRRSASQWPGGAAVLLPLRNPLPVDFARGLLERSSYLGPIVQLAVRQEAARPDMALRALR